MTVVVISVGVAQKAAIDGVGDEVPYPAEEETSPAAVRRVRRVLPCLLDALPVHDLGARLVSLLLHPGSDEHGPQFQPGVRGRRLVRRTG